MRFSTSRILKGAAAAALIAVTAYAAPLSASEEPVVIPAPAMDAESATATQTAVLAGGCFWGVQGVFQHTAGVLSAVSGYAGGDKSTANYTAIGTGTTGHAEAVEIKYDPKQISYGKLLQIFFSVVHDPTQLNRQGPDTGSHYRSAIFTVNDEQKKVADAYVAQLNAAKVYPKPIVTKIGALPKFYAAEAYHQDYMMKNPNSSYIVIHDRPKVEALKKLFAANYTPKPTLVGGAKLTAN